MPADAVLFIGYGGPTAPDEIRPYLQNVAKGRPIPPERLEEVAHHYELIGGRSPYNDACVRLMRATEARLKELDRPMPCALGLRNWSPYLRDAVETLWREGHRRAVGVILAPHRCEASWERYQQDVREAQETSEVVKGGLEMRYLRAWHDDPLLLEAMAQRIEAMVPWSRDDWPPEVPLVLTAHSIPTGMAVECDYVNELFATAGGVADLLGAGRWSLAYQSRSGPPRQPWLEPDINDVLRAQAAEGVREVVVAPVGFLSDHVEVLFDLDVEARATAQGLGMTLHRGGTVEDHPLFAELLANRIVEASDAREVNNEQ